MSDQKTDYVTEGQGRLLQQFHGSVNLLALAESFLNQAQAFEDATYPMLTQRGIDNMDGDRLDGLGQIVKLKRGGRSDADYKQALRAELAILRSKGTAEEILTIAQLLIQMATADYELVEYYPKALYLRPVDHVIGVDPAYSAAALRRAVSAATEFLFVFSYAADDETFQFSSTTSSETDSSTGFAPVWTLQGNWAYDATSTALAGLSSGDFRFNDADPTKATEIYIYDTDTGATDRTAFLTALSGGLVFGNVYVWLSYWVTASVDNGSTFTLTVIACDKNGTINDTDAVNAYTSTGGVFAGSA